MPGTVDQWPNWSLVLPQDIETMVEAELPRRIAKALGRSANCRWDQVRGTRAWVGERRPTT